MIRIPIAEEIWNKKYRNNGETEQETYNRQVKGIFDDVPEETLRKYATIAGFIDVTSFLAFCHSMLTDHLFGFGGRGTHALGTQKKYQSFSNCFVNPFKKDSMEAILDCVKESGLTMKAGGGVGYSFSILRPKTEKLKTTGGETSGIISFMRLFDALCAQIKTGGDRRGAQLCSLGAWHPEIKEYITCKRDGSLSNFNISVLVSDEFMKAVESDGDWDLIFPVTSHPAYDTEWDGNIKGWKSKGYPVKVFETVKAKELFETIMKSNFNFAEPGILFEDQINKNNNLSYLGEYILTVNPCGEQPLYWYSNCNLGFVNLYNMTTGKFTDESKFDFDLLSKAVSCAVIMMDRVIDINYMPIQQQQEEMDNKRPIGLGFTGLGDTLHAMKLKYSSQEGRNLAEEITKCMMNVSYLTSSKLAKEIGQFPLYEKEMINAPMFQKLDDEIVVHICQHGMRNSRLLTVAPVGTMSLFHNNCTSGIEPAFELSYIRKIKDDQGVQQEQEVDVLSWYDYKNQFHTEEKPEWFETAMEIDPQDHIKMQAVVQKYVCSAISKTVNFPVDGSFDSFKDIYLSAWKLGLKGTTTYRPNSVVGSVLEVKKDKKESEKEVKKEQKEFYDAWKDHDSNVVIDEVQIPSEFPSYSYKLKSEGKKWYVTLSFKDKSQKKPFAVWVHTNHPESNIDTMNTLEMLEKLAERMNIKKDHIEDCQRKYSNQKNVTKIARMLGLLLRHNVNVGEIVKVLDAVEVPVSSFIFRIKKLLAGFVEEMEGRTKCPNCEDGYMVYENGCVLCRSCHFTKC